MEAGIALGVLPEGYPEWDYTTGQHYSEGDIIQIFSDTDSFATDLGEGSEEREYNVLGLNLMRTIQNLERAEKEKEITLKKIKSRLEKEWTARVLADSLEGSCINMKPSEIKYRLPTTPEEGRKVRRSTSI